MSYCLTHSTYRPRLLQLEREKCAIFTARAISFPHATPATIFNFLSAVAVMAVAKTQTAKAFFDVGLEVVSRLRQLLF